MSSLILCLSKCPFRKACHRGEHARKFQFTETLDALQFKDPETHYSVEIVTSRCCQGIYSIEYRNQTPQSSKDCNLPSYRMPGSQE